MTPLSVVVFDCNTFLQGVISDRGPGAACLDLFRSGAVTLVLSPDVLAEIRDVLNRSELRQRFRRLTPERVEELLQSLVSTATLVTEVPRYFELPRDPKDEPYLNLAITAGANYLITRDKDLLDLMDQGKKDGREFRQRYPELTILDPTDFLELQARPERSEERP